MKLSRFFIVLLICCFPIINTVAQGVDYTRGIGIYPGNTSESFAPQMIKDNTYRNIALNRTAYHSSAYDYNLTAQLTTDGIFSQSTPAFLQVTTPKGELGRRERESAIDGGEYTRNILMGENTYLQYSWHNMQVVAEEANLIMQVAYDKQRATSGYEIVFLVSDNGKQWKAAGSITGKGLPGKSLTYQVHSDPNKVTDNDLLPALSVNIKTWLRIQKFSHLKLVLKMKGAVHWTVTQLNFYNNGKRVTNQLPAKHFGSAWMSSGGGTQWIYTDLGTVATFDRVRLHWLHKALKGRIETSNDAENWITVAQLPGGKSRTDDIVCNGKGRYVRVLMQQPEAFGKYVLSELEVMGRGGLKPKPQSIAGRKGDKYLIDGGNWRLQRASQVVSTGEEISQNGFDDNNWLVATVPATVLTSYVNAGALPNPNYSDNLFHISESFFNSNFWYRTEFDIPAYMQGKHVFLNLDGINWKANIYLNGKKINRIEGAFMRGKTDVTDVIKQGKNCLAVEIICNAHPGAVKEKTLQNTDFNGGILGADNPTFHATIGWDWISTIRGRNIGIWNDVYLTSSGGLKMSDPLVTATLNLPDTLATVTPKVVVSNVENRSVKAILSGWIGKAQFKKNIEIPAKSVREISFNPEEYAALKQKAFRLWWPNGYGDPYLYDAGFAVSTEEGISDSIHFKAGIRQVSYKDVDTQLKIFVNGKRFVPLGGNWGFSENNLNYRNREYGIAVKYHRDMNCNTIRNWVGQTGDEEFYEACDKYGIMVWQDFWLANPADGANPDDVQMFLRNADDYIKRIRQHASIMLYCGRNEGYPPKELDNKLREYVSTLHPDITYISSSADEGVSGHGPYWALSAKTYFEKQTGKLHTERGMPNVMSYESMTRTLKPAEMWKQNDKWGQHDYTLHGAQRGASFNELIEKGVGTPQNAKQFTEFAQWINYQGYRAMYESGSKDRMGLLIWMSHPCWPSMVWQTYDYYFEPTAAYFGVKKACEPIHIQWNAATRNVEVVNRCAGNRIGIKAIAEVFDMNGKMVWSKIETIDSHQDETVVLTNIAQPQSIKDVYYIKLSLQDKMNNVLSENFYIESVDDGNCQALKNLPQVHLQKQITIKRKQDKWIAELMLENNNDVPALMIRLNLKGEDGEQILPVNYDDNYFSFLPGEKKNVQISWKEEDTRGCSAVIDVTGYNIK